MAELADLVRSGQQDQPWLLVDYERVAQEILGAPENAYFLKGAGSQITYARNINDLASVTLLPRSLVNLKDGSSSCNLLGRDHDTPILVAPMAFQKLLHDDAESGVAAAATAQGCGMVLSAQASQPMAEVRSSGENCSWMQLYWQVSREANLIFAQRAAECGFQALALTVDAPVQGVRDAEIRAGFKLPSSIQSVNLQGMPQPKFAPLEDHESIIFDRISHILPTWDDVAWFCKNAPLPVLLKGIMHPEDAKRAVNEGCAGIIVSNHGGRVLDGAPSTISVLPGIAEAVQDRVPILMDGGIRRGGDVFKAIALGADAVLVGRPVCHGLAVAGAQGVSHVLRLLRDELEITMALMGCARLSDITREKVHVPKELLIF